MRAEEQKLANARSLLLKEKKKEQERLEDLRQLEYIKEQERQARCDLFCACARVWNEACWLCANMGVCVS